MTGVREQLETALLRARERSNMLTECVDDADLVAQHSPLMSPLVWDLAHIGNQEELWLVRDVGGRDPVRRDIDELYDAFKHARSTRPALPLLGPAETRRYVGQVRHKMWDVLDASSFRGRRLEHDGFAFAMIAQHEQQHAETMLATHQLRKGAPVLTASPVPAGAALPAREAVIPAGEFTMGTSDDRWALDNERPAHRVYVEEFAIDTAPVTNGDYARFIDDGGYRRRELWSDRGWRHRHESGLEAPMFWTGDGSGTWWRHHFGGLEPVPAEEPVVHVCWFEAQAYARWAGKRLPTEAEWEKAARWHPVSGRSRRFPWGDDEPDRTRANLGQHHLGPAPVGAYPAGASPLGVQQLMGDVWEWTASAFTGYPGFAAFPYREYSEVFFDGDYRVLRGGSFGTDSIACRGTFRNWDHPIRRQIFAGFRCARDT
ncbi:ergothioneine biosynthesis protein EgtB [Prescottella defluvii]|uniref:ergothioneine biosynthesis protein EgtB n=1 Tax=Prescottella defluvii TaxID=1323361 RepID=UPI000A92F7F7|nr:ergothioneine biosynthesis protein EgtB [Prescottella defluvii]